MARAISPGPRRAVPLKSMCSWRWARPASSSFSSALPTRTQTCRAATGAAWFSSTRTVSPLGNVVFTEPSLTPPRRFVAPSERRGDGAGQRARRLEVGQVARSLEENELGVGEVPAEEVEGARRQAAVGGSPDDAQRKPPRRELCVADEVPRGDPH